MSGDNLSGALHRRWLCPATPCIESEDEAPLAGPLQVPCEHRRDHRAAREGIATRVPI